MARISKANRDVTPRRQHKENTASLALEMYLSLPREIRNRIYAFCVQGSIDNEVIVRRATGSKHGIVLLQRERADFQPYRWVEDPFASLLKVEDAGLESALELLEAYYWARTFKFDERQIPCLGAFLTTDLFALPMRPADYVRSLHFQIRPFIYAVPDHANAKQREQRRYCEALKALSVLQGTRPRIRIVIDLAPSAIEELRHSRCMEIVDDFLQELLSTIVELKMQGLRIDVSYSTDWNDARGTTVQVDSISSIGPCIAALRLAYKTDQPCANL